MTIAKRFDRGGELLKPVKTAEGWLFVDGYLTRTGVFRYRNGDGTERRELRLPEEVFKGDALASFSLRPVTREHPPGWLDSTNTRLHAVGAVSESVQQDGKRVRARMLITDEAAVRDLEDGTRREISCGYSCELEMTPGEYEGERYDGIQRNIRGNHVAIVEAGRAGPEVRVRMDAADAMQVITPQGAPAAPANEGAAIVKVQISGVTYDVGNDTAAQAIEKMRSDSAAESARLTSELEKSKKEAATAAARADAAEEEVKKLKAQVADAADPKKLRAQIQARATLESTAKELLGKKCPAKLDSLSDEDIQRAVISRASPERKLDGKDAAYIAAAFDMAVDRLRADAEEDDLSSARRVSDRQDDPDEEREDEDDEDDDREDAEDDEDSEEEPAARVDRDSGTRKPKHKDALSAREAMIQKNRDASRLPLNSSRKTRRA